MELGREVELFVDLVYVAKSPFSFKPLARSWLEVLSIIFGSACVAILLICWYSGSALLCTVQYFVIAALLLLR